MDTYNEIPIAASKMIRMINAARFPSFFIEAMIKYITNAITANIGTNHIIQTMLGYIESIIAHSTLLPDRHLYC